MKDSIKQYFQFSRRERNGVFLLLFVLLALIVLKFTVPFWVTVDETEANKEFAKNAQELKKLAQKQEKVKESIILKPFNPNLFSYDSLVGSGLPENLSRQVINYRTKVGAFKTKADFAKLYNLTDSMYKILEPFILLPAIAEKEPSHTVTKKIIIELNTADSLQLLTVKGIGPFFAYKILEYRRQLGGYFTLDQLSEAFYINANTLAEKEQRMNEIKAQLKVNPSLITKTSINTATQKELSRHPYIGYKESKAIVKHRTKKGLLTSEEDLLASGIFSAEKIKLLHPYISY